MEVGVAQGATFCGAIKDNTVNAIAIDSWQTDIQPADPNAPKLPHNEKENFLKNLENYKQDNNIDVIDKDIFEVDLSPYLGKVDAFFYDGPHDALSTEQAILHYKNVFADEAVLIFDDANWEGVVEGARNGANKAGLEVAYEKMLLCDVEDLESWWNGLYILVINKPKENLISIEEITEW
tara:strand:- start:393 stop:932 length:540 start_codon:yes stop_codon:yes gene_type:complete